MVRVSSYPEGILTTRIQSCVESKLVREEVIL